MLTVRWASLITMLLPSAFTLGPNVPGGRKCEQAAARKPTQHPTRTVDRVILDQIGHGLHGCNIIDVYKLEGVGLRPGQSQGQAADPARPIYRYFDWSHFHLRLPRPWLRQVQVLCVMVVLQLRLLGIFRSALKRKRESAEA